MRDVLCCSHLLMWLFHAECSYLFAVFFLFGIFTWCIIDFHVLLIFQLRQNERKQQIIINAQHEISTSIGNNQGERSINELRQKCRFRKERTTCVECKQNNNWTGNESNHQHMNATTQHGERGRKTHLITVRNKRRRNLQWSDQNMINFENYNNNNIDSFSLNKYRIDFLYLFP